MTHRRRLLCLLPIGLAVAVGAGWWWFARLQSLPFKIVLKGPSAYSGGRGVSGGNLVVVSPKPGIFFGTVTKPDSEEQFPYVILFRYGRPKSDGFSRSLQGNCTNGSYSSESNNAIELDGKRIEAVYRFEHTAVENESLTIGGESVDIRSGQVFLINLSDQATVYRQKNLELPAISSKLESPQDVERLAEAVRKSLESQDPEIKAFLRSVDELTTEPN